MGTPSLDVFWLFYYVDPLSRENLGHFSVHFQWSHFLVQISESYRGSRSHFLVQISESYRGLRLPFLGHFSERILRTLPKEHFFGKVL